MSICMPSGKGGPNTRPTPTSRAAVEEARFQSSRLSQVIQDLVRIQRMIKHRRCPLNNSLSRDECSGCQQKDPQHDQRTLDKLRERLMVEREALRKAVKAAHTAGLL